MSVSQNFPNVRPQTLIDIANTGKLDPRIAFSRASTGTYYDKNGILQTADVNVPRIDYDPVTGQARGLLRENQATNLVLNSDTLVTQNVTVTAVAHTLSFYGTGTVVLSGTATDTVVGLGDYPTRTVLIFTPTAGTLTLTVTGTVEKAQLETGDKATSYIKTEASQVTRAADSAVLTNQGDYNTTEYTAVTEPFGVSSVSAQTAVLNGDVPIERLYVYPRNISQDEINAITKNDGTWAWRVEGTSFALPNFDTDGTVEVDWGDGTVETLTTSEHTFSNQSPHTVKFRLTSGTYFRPKINNNSSHDQKVIAVGPAPSNMIVDCESAFEGCTNLKSIDATLVGRTNFYRICRSCISLTSFPQIDSSNGTFFRDAWQGCNSLTSFPLIDTSSGTGFSRTWNGCSSLISFPQLDMSSAAFVTQCWDRCSSLTSFPAIDLPSCTLFREAWEDCSSLTSFPLIDTSSGTNFEIAWRNCSSLTSFPLIDTSSGTDFEQTWYGCSSLTSFPLIDTSSGTNFRRAWFNCHSLTSFPLIDTSSGTNFDGAWAICSSLTSFPLIDTSSGTNFERAWDNCSSLTSFPLIDTSSGTNFERAWEDCSSLTDFPANFFDSWTGTPVNSCFVNAWDGCSSLTATSVENILNSIDTSGQSAPASGVDITIDYDTGTGTPSVSTAVTNLKSRGWTITLNGVAQ